MEIGNVKNQKQRDENATAANVQLLRKVAFRILKTSTNCPKKQTNKQQQKARRKPKKKHTHTVRKRDRDRDSSANLHSQAKKRLKRNKTESKTFFLSLLT